MAVVVETIVCLPHTEACVEIVRAVDDVLTHVCGYIVFLPWERHYSIYDESGRWLQGGLTTLEAATEHARGMSWHG